MDMEIVVKYSNTLALYLENSVSFHHMVSLVRFRKFFTILKAFINARSLWSFILMFYKSSQGFIQGVFSWVRFFAEKIEFR